MASKSYSHFINPSWYNLGDFFGFGKFRVYWDLGILNLKFKEDDGSESIQYFEFSVKSLF